MKRVQTLQLKRASLIASRISGSQQDPLLKEDEVLLKKLDAEIFRIRQFNNKSVTLPRLISTPFIENGTHISVETALKGLTLAKKDVTERLNERRIEIKQEVERDLKYGLAKERQIKARSSNEIMFFRSENSTIVNNLFHIDSTTTTQHLTILPLTENERIKMAYTSILGDSESEDEDENSVDPNPSAKLQSGDVDVNAVQSELFQCAGPAAESESFKSQSPINAIKCFKAIVQRGDLVAAENFLVDSLELDPENIQLIQAYAVFLHQKRGYVSQAEAIFIRGLETCMPDFAEKTWQKHQLVPRSHSSTHNLFDRSEDGDIQTTKSNVSGLSGTITIPTKRIRVKYVVELLLSYARFMIRAKGDLVFAENLYRKALEVTPTDHIVVGSLAHFLSTQIEDETATNEAGILFKRAMQLEPRNVQIALWYAKLLKHTSKISEAELMYKVAVKNSITSKNRAFWEPTAICNYATFVYRCRQQVDITHGLFSDGIKRYPGHRGLLKNFNAFLKANPGYGSISDYQPPLVFRKIRSTSKMAPLDNTANASDINITTSLNVSTHA